MIAKSILFGISFLAVTSFAKTTIVVCNGVNDDSRYAFNLRFNHSIRQYSGTLVDKQAPTSKQIVVSRDLVFSNSSYYDDLKTLEMVGLKLDSELSKQTGKPVMVQDQSIRFSIRGMVKTISVNGIPIELEQVCAKNQGFLDNILSYMEENARAIHGH